MAKCVDLAGAETALAEVGYGPLGEGMTEGAVSVGEAYPDWTFTEAALPQSRQLASTRGDRVWTRSGSSAGLWPQKG